MSDMLEQKKEPKSSKKEKKIVDTKRAQNKILGRTLCTSVIGYLSMCPAPTGARGATMPYAIFRVFSLVLLT